MQRVLAVTVVALVSQLACRQPPLADRTAPAPHRTAPAPAPPLPRAPRPRNEHLLEIVPVRAKSKLKAKGGALAYLLPEPDVNNKISGIVVNRIPNSGESSGAGSRERAAHAPGEDLSEVEIDRIKNLVSYFNNVGDAGTGRPRHRVRYVVRKKHARDRPSASETRESPAHAPDRPSASETRESPAHAPDRPSASETRESPAHAPDRPSASETRESPAHAPDRPSASETRESPAHAPDRPSASETHAQLEHVSDSASSHPPHLQEVTMDSRIRDGQQVNEHVAARSQYFESGDASHNETNEHDERLKYDGNNIHDDGNIIHDNENNIHDEENNINDDINNIHDEENNINDDINNIHDEENNINDDINNVYYDGNVIHDVENNINDDGNNIHHDANDTHQDPSRLTASESESHSIGEKGTVTEHITIDNSNDGDVRDVHIFYDSILDSARDHHRDMSPNSHEGDSKEEPDDEIRVHHAESEGHHHANFNDASNTGDTNIYLNKPSDGWENEFLSDSSSDSESDSAETDMSDKSDKNDKSDKPVADALAGVSLDDDSSSESDEYKADDEGSADGDDGSGDDAGDGVPASRECREAEHTHKCVGRCRGHSYKLTFLFNR